jgi:hypothetical protein
MSANANADEKVSEFDQLTQDYINSVYQGVSGFISYQPGEKESNEVNKVFLTYGEILYPSVNKFLNYMDITEDDVFYDLGSGIGKVALQVFLKTPVKKAFGLEASESRTAMAQKVYNNVKQEFPELFENGRELGTSVANFLEADLSDATIIYSCSTCFSEELLSDMGKAIDRCPNIRYVVSLKQIPSKVPFDRILEIECTWDKTKCYVYSFPKEGEESRQISVHEENVGHKAHLEHAEQTEHDEYSSHQEQEEEDEEQNTDF